MSVILYSTGPEDFTAETFAEAAKEIMFVGAGNVEMFFKTLTEAEEAAGGADVPGAKVKITFELV